MKRTFTLSAGNYALSLPRWGAFLHLPHSGLDDAQPPYSAEDCSMEKTYIWTYNIIRSCNNDFHFDCADALIDLFSQKYGENDLLLQLKELRQNKWSAVHSILN